MDEMSISDLMIRDHERIMGLLEQLAEGAGSVEMLKWELERHLFVEEKATFNIQVQGSSQDSDAALRLMKEHDAIIKMLQSMEKAKGLGLMNEARKLKGFLQKHSDFEDENFYPSLDRSLSNTQKEVIFKRIHDIMIDYEAESVKDEAFKVRMNPIKKSYGHNTIMVHQKIKH